jgi:hypothetical protein
VVNWNRYQSSLSLAVHNSTLVIIGDGPLHAALKPEAQQIGLQDSVFLLVDVLTWRRSGPGRQHPDGRDVRNAASAMLRDVLAR